MSNKSKTTSRPIWIIARKEMKETWRDGRFRILAVCILSLLVAGLAAGRLETREAQQAIDQARAADQEVWLNQGPRNPHSAAHFGNYAFKPRPALSAFDRGLDLYLGTAVWLEAHWQDPFALRPAEDRTALQRFGELTAAFTLQVPAALLIIFLGFAAFAGEREQGTLKQLAALGLRARSLALGKALGLGIALGLVLLPAVAIGSFILAGGGEAPIGGILALVAAYGLYFAVLFALVLAVSAWARSGRQALVMLLSFWMLSTLVIPRLVADAAERLHPIPTPRVFFDAIAQDKAQGLDGEGDRQERGQKLRQEVMEKYGVENLEELPISFAGLSLQASEEQANGVFDKHYGELWRLYTDQERLHLWGSALSPMLALRSISMAVAGTDVTRHRHFADAAEEHRRKMVKFLNDDLTHNAAGSDFGYLADRELWQETPRFSYQPPGLDQVLLRQLPAFGWLTVWLLVTCAAAIRLSSRLRVVAGEPT